MKRILLTLSLLIIATPSLSWDTMVIREEVGPAWQSIYQEDDQPASIAEHTHISDLTFDRLDPSGGLRRLFGRQGSAGLEVMDLNATHFRREALSGTARFGDDEGTLVEERLIPPPALFAGLPDYSYAMQDWLNKNTTCPAFESNDYAFRCHEFIGWLGAMNSIHFGSQAQAMYAHHHRSAVMLAQRVGTLRDEMTDAEEDDYRELLLEMELEALAYEGYAQHFLQDRWAIGHMWERWNAPDPVQQPATLANHLAIGAVAGIIHGAEALVRDYSFLSFVLMEADPMSSPLPAASGRLARPMQYRHVSRPDDPPVYAVGDERLRDAVRGSFSAGTYYPGRGDEVLPVAQQVGTFFSCAGAGWAEVIRAFGPGRAGGTWGTHEAPLSEGAPSFNVLVETTCWDMWATNQSMVTGFLGPNPGLSLEGLAVIDFAAAGTAPSASTLTDVGIGSRTELIAHGARMWLYAQVEPDGTQVAQGQMRSLGSAVGNFFGADTPAGDASDLWGFRAGRHYSLPAYAEPIGLPSDLTPGIGNPLPMEDPRGRDAQTLFGVFNRAHADYWCADRELLTEMREDFYTYQQEVCQRMASMVYAGTHPAYEGTQSRTREYGGEETRSICTLRNAQRPESDTEDDQDNPFWLDQGYIAREGADETLQSHPTNPFQEITNWCGRTPIIDLNDDPDLRDENVVVEIDESDSSLTLNGWDFGEREGRVVAYLEGAQQTNLDEVLSWSDREIQLNIADIQWESGRDYELEVTALPDSGVWPEAISVGLFRLRVRDEEAPPPPQFVDLDLGGVGPCRDDVPDFTFLDLAPSLPQTPNSDTLLELNEQFQQGFAPVVTYLERQLACMRSLQSQNWPGREAVLPLHQVGVGVEEPGYTRDNVIFTNGIGIHEPNMTGRAYLRHPAYSAVFDPYTIFIQSLDYAIRNIQQSMAIVDVWADAFDPDYEPYLMPTQTLMTILRGRGIVDPEELRSEFFTDARNDPAFSPGMDVPQVRQAYDLVRWEAARNELAWSGDVATRLTNSILPGMAPWAQMEHMGTSVIVPLAREALDEGHSLTAQAMRAYARANPCEVSELQPYCIYGIPGEEIDAYMARFFAIESWVSEMSSGFAAPPDVAVGYELPDGSTHLYPAWPDERMLELTRTIPPGVQ